MVGLRDEKEKGGGDLICVITHLRHQYVHLITLAGVTCTQTTQRITQGLCEHQTFIVRGIKNIRDSLTSSVIHSLTTCPWVIIKTDLMNAC